MMTVRLAIDNEEQQCEAHYDALMTIYSRNRNL